MEKSESIIELAKAFTKFQSEIQNVSKNASNSFFKSKYATLDSMWDTVRPVLTEHGLSLSQFPTGENELTNILMHESGEFLQSTVKMAPKENSPQAIGSAITYMRRYAMGAILGIATEEDDDGNAASKGDKPSSQATTKPPVKKPTAAQKKMKIVSLMGELGHNLKELEKEEAAELIKDKSGLPVEDKNLDEIVSRLSVLVDDKKESKK